MNKYSFALYSLIFAFCLFTEAFTQAPIHYKQPARNWNEALPVGNGRLGVMTFGRVNEELLQLRWLVPCNKQVTKILVSQDSAIRIKCLL